MKKLLALVLALVMVMGLSVVGANAAEYSDADSITYKEAVDVMSAIGVLGGTDGKFNPNEPLTREQGAKILTYMLMGGNQKSADALTVAAAPFTDVAADRWSAGSIAYCKAAGILGGKGDGTFGPTEPLTGAAFAKMCLVALGYDANREGLGGSDWTLNVASLVNRTALAADIPAFSVNSVITRQEAAQLGLNTLKATMVEYTGNLTADNKGNLVAARGNVANNEYSYQSSSAAQIATASMQFVENYFPNVKLITSVSATDGKGTNDFGVAVDRWFIANNRLDYTVTDAKLAVTAEKADTAATYTTEVKDVTNGTLYTLAGNNAFTYTVKENGANATGITVAKGSTTKDLAKYSGATVKVLDTTDNGNADTIDVEYSYLAKVTKVTAATSSKNRFITMEVYNKLTPTTGVEFETEDFAKDDYVLVYPKGNIATTTAWATANNATEFNASGNVIKVEAAQSVNGTVTAVTGTNGAAVTAITVDGAKYSAGNASFAFLGATKGTDAVADTNYGLGDGYTLYLSNGYVLGVKGDSAEYTDYVYIAAADAHTGGLANYDDVTYVTQDGLVHTTKQNGTALSTANQPGWYTIEEDSENEGYHKFTAKGVATAALALSTGTAIKSNTPTIATGIVADSKTVFMLRTGTSTFKVYTGISSVGNWTGATAANTRIVTSAGDNVAGTAKLVYIDVQSGNNDSSNDTPIFLLKLDGSTRIGNKNYYTYKAIVDGELVDVTGTSATLLSGLGVGGTAGVTYGALVMPTYNSDGYLTGVSLTGTDTLGDTTTTTKYLAVDSGSVISESNGTLTVGGVAYTMASDASVYFWKTDADSLKTEVDDIEGTVTGIIYLQFASSSNPTVKAVYVSGTIA